MIPFIQIHSIPFFGVIKIQPFGLCVVIGVLLGAWLCRYRAKKVGLSVERVLDIARVAVISGFVGAHWLDLIFYTPERILDEGFVVFFKFWDGWSSWGGFIGAFIGLFIYFKVTQTKKWWREADVLVEGLMLGWIFGRLGCAIVHDHPGKKLLNQAWYSVAYPDGPRYDLGLTEFALTLFFLFPLSQILVRAKQKYSYLKDGALSVGIVMAYAPVRFLLDFLRADSLDGGDLRYLGLTPAQYVCVFIFMALPLYWTKAQKSLK